MNKNGRKKSQKNKRKISVLLASFFLLLIVSVGGTLAFLVHSTGPVTNTFTLDQVPNEVVEDFDGSIKKDVAIKNKSENQPAYIRARVVVNWVEIDDKDTPTNNVFGTDPVECTCEGDCTGTCDYSIDWAAFEQYGWQKYGSYYYYTSPVAAGAETGVLFTNCSPINLLDGITPNQPEGYKLSVEIVAQSIQADGTDSKGNKPIELAWGVDIVDGNVIPASITE